MYVRNLNGDEFLLQATTTHDLELVGNQSLTFTIKPNKTNNIFINEISEMWEVIDDDDVVHKIIYAKKKGEGDSLSVDIKAIPMFFDAFDTDRIYEEYNESMTAHSAFSKVFTGTDFTFVLIDSFTSVEWEGFGKGDTRLEIFKRCLDRYKAEFRIGGNTVYLESLIGRDTQFMYRYRLNASNIEQEIDASAMWTHAKGYGNFGEGTSDDDSGSGDYHDAKLKREYTSPLASILGVRHAPPIMDGRITVAATMDASLKKLVDESLKISVSASIHDLRKQGYAIGQPEVGDRVFLIDERIGLHEEVRVIDMSITKDWQGNVLDLNLTFGSESIVKRHQSNISTAVGAITELLEGKRKLPSSALENAILQATKALQSAQTELKFSGNGILAIDKNNPNYVTLFNSAGIGVSVDGGATYRQAMTAAGINTDLLTAGAIDTGNIKIVGQNNLFYWDGNSLNAINPRDSSRFVKLSSAGLEVQNGMISVKGQAGTVIIDGTSNMHKILATGIMNVNVPAGAVEYNASIAHNLGYTPAFSAFMQGDSSQPIEDGYSYALPRLITASGGDSLTLLSNIRGEATKDRFYVRVRRAQNYGASLPAKTIVIRYFIYKEVAF